jgi:hypothetical protein
LVKKSLLLKTQQLILGTGTAIWWLTEPQLRRLEIFYFKIASLSKIAKPTSHVYMSHEKSTATYFGTTSVPKKYSFKTLTPVADFINMLLA